MDGTERSAENRGASRCSISALDRLDERLRSLERRVFDQRPLDERQRTLRVALDARDLPHVLIGERLAHRPGRLEQGHRPERAAREVELADLHRADRDVGAHLSALGVALERLHQRPQLAVGVAHGARDEPETPVQRGELAGAASLARPHHLLDERERLLRSAGEEESVGEQRDAVGIRGSQRARLLKRGDRGLGLVRLLEEQRAGSKEPREPLCDVTARVSVLERELRELSPRAGQLVDALEALGHRPVLRRHDPRALESASGVTRTARVFARVREPESRVHGRLAFFDPDEATERRARSVPAFERDLEIRERLEGLAVLRVLLDQVSEDGARTIGVAGDRQHRRLSEAKRAHGSDVPGGPFDGHLQALAERSRIRTRLERERRLEVVERPVAVARRAADARARPEQSGAGGVVGRQAIEGGP